MKKVLGWAAVGLLCVMISWAADDAKRAVQVDADISVGPKPGTTESMTVIQQGPNGETRIMSKETDGGKARKTPAGSGA